MTQEEKKAIINAVLQQIKAQSSDITELPTATSLDNVKSLPAMQGSSLVSAPISMLSKPATDAAKLATEAATYAVEATTDANSARDLAKEAAKFAQDSAINVESIYNLGEVKNFDKASELAANETVYGNNKIKILRWTSPYSASAHAKGGIIIQNSFETAGSKYVYQVGLFVGAGASCLGRKISGGIPSAWEDIIIPKKFLYVEGTRTVEAILPDGVFGKNMFTIPLASNTTAGLVKLGSDFDVSDEILSITDLAKKKLFIDMWNAACKNYGKYNSVTGFFELNGLTDITYEEALTIYKLTYSTTFVKSNYSGGLIKTNIPVRASKEAIDFSYVYSYFTKLKIIILPTYMYSTEALPSTLAYAFAYDDSLEEIRPIIDCSKCTSFTMAFAMCYRLKKVMLKNVKYNVHFLNSASLSLESFTYIIENAANTSPITITVHQDVYAKLTDESNTEWNELLTKAAEKQISFATTN